MPKNKHVFHASPEADLHIIRPRGKSTSTVQQPTAGFYVAPKFKDAVQWAVSYVTHKKDQMKRRKSGQRAYHKKPLYYLHITIYKLKVPQTILDDAWSEEWWEPEYFIPESCLPNIEIVQRKTYSIQELRALSDRNNSIRNDHLCNRTDTIKIAQKVRLTNFAAKEFLRLKDLLATCILKKQIKSFDHRFALERMRKLSSYFSTQHWCSPEPIPLLEKEKREEVEAIVSQIESTFCENKS